MVCSVPPLLLHIIPVLQQLVADDPTVCCCNSSSQPTGSCPLTQPPPSADDLAQTSFAFWGGSLKLAEAKVWYPDGLPPAVQAAQQQQPQQPGLVFQTARQLAQPAVAQPAALRLALGPAVDVSGFSCGSADSSGGMSSGSGSSSHGVEGAAAVKPKKPHARAGGCSLVLAACLCSRRKIVGG